MYWLLFQASVPPMGWNSYYISRSTGSNSIRYVATMVSPRNDTVEVGPGSLKLSFSSASGQLERIFNSVSGVDLPIQQSFFWYSSNQGDIVDAQGSGAYVFRPNGTTPTIVSSSVLLSVIHGPLVHEVHQQFGPWINQITRLYKNKEHAEVEYTVRNYREDWDLEVTEPVAGNYYPVNLGVYVADGKYELSVLVDRAVGASSIQDGQLEIMLHRRVIRDDDKGVDEPLGEVVCLDGSCKGLTVRGTYYVKVDKIGHGAHWRRTYGQQVYSPYLLAFTHEDETSWKSYNVAKQSTMDENYSLPDNVAIITLQNLDDDTTLLRLAHLFQDLEDAQYSVIAKVELRRVFGKRTIKELAETNLSANQKKSEMKKLNWRVLGNDKSDPIPLKGGPVDSQALVVELGPMEIRTFLLKF
uniref:Alpha-mannosidase n=2 Tax=Zea mays TaxID=4577 RepID=B4FGT7_MAIZE|nr:unknown [Zea mays]|eukprot:NP_001132479.1 uncharacterized protein LOC100193937 [Zea mays]